jgi:hypothetical protein
LPFTKLKLVILWQVLTDQGHPVKSRRDTFVEPSKVVTDRVSSFVAFTLLYRRALFNVVRDKPVFGTKIFSNVAMGLLFGGVSFQLKNDQIGARGGFGWR